MKSPPARILFAPPDRQAWSDLGRGLGLAAAAGLFLSISGAFGSAGWPGARRLAYWMPLMIGGGLWGALCSAIVGRLVDVETRPWLQFVLLTLALTAPMTVAVWAVSGPFYVGRMLPPELMTEFLVPVMAVSAVMSWLGIFLARRPAKTHAGPADAPPPRFLERMPPRLRGARLLAVEAEDHYLRLHTDRGSDLILMRLSDALGELQGLEGAQTHRSWWVARAAVRGVSRGDGRATLTLEDGLRAPVSRRYARALRADGWY